MYECAIPSWGKVVLLRACESKAFNWKAHEKYHTVMVKTASWKLKLLNEKHIKKYHTVIVITASCYSESCVEFWSSWVLNLMNCVWPHVYHFDTMCIFFPDTLTVNGGSASLKAASIWGVLRGESQIAPNTFFPL